jgi:hypothetical protein
MTFQISGVGRVEQSETRQRLPPTHREIVVVFQQVPKTMPTVSGFAITLYPTYDFCITDLIVFFCIFILFFCARIKEEARTLLFWWLKCWQDYRG